MQLFYNSPHFGELKYDEFFMFYEEPLLFTVTNTVNNEFLCILSSEENEDRKWLLVPVTEQRIQNVKTGYISVKECFMKPENQLFLIENEKSLWKETPVKSGEISEEYFPDEKLYLNIDDWQEDDIVANQVAEERRTVFDIRLIEKRNPNLHEVPLKHYAPLVNQLYSMSMNYVKYANKLQTIPSLERKKQAQLDVALPKAGSFIIRFKAHEIADIANQNYIISCILEDLFDLVGSDGDKFDTLIKNCRNQIVGSYRKLMSEIVNEDYDFEFKFITPDRQIKRTRIDQKNIRMRIGKIDSYLQANEEVCDYKGYLTGGQVSKGNFIFVTEDNEVIRGDIENKALETLVLSKTKIVTAKLRVKVIFNEQLNNYKEEYTLLDIQY